MRFQQNSLFATLLGAQSFAKEYVSEFSTSVDLTGALRRLDEVVAEFSTHAVDQRTNDRTVRGETAKQQQLRLELRTQQMTPIAEIARRNLRTTPEFKSLQMPKPNVVGQAFIADAQGMGKAAAVHKDTLIERGLPADFLDQFQTALSQLESSAAAREKSRTGRMGATKALSALEKEGRSVLKVLDVLVRRALLGNEALLGAWAGARAIRRRPGGSSTPSGSNTAGSTNGAVTTPTTPAAAAAVSEATPTAIPTAAA